MKRLDATHAHSRAQLNTVLPFIVPTLIREPLTESEILSIQDRFLTNGFQHIKVKDIPAGRVLIHMFMQFLQSLHVYHDIAAFTLSQTPLKEGIFDVYGELLMQPKSTAIDEFFLDNFYFDFIWIEATKKLVDQPVYAEFEKYIIDMQLDTHIPIVVLWYEEE